MFRLILVLLGIATVIGLLGLSGVAGFTWTGVKTTTYVFLMVPVGILLLAALKKSFAAHTMITHRAVFFVVILYAALAFLI